MWTASDFGSAILLLGMVMYAIFGGADFGGGVWTALASGPRRREQRESLFLAIGPVWETNHVWLIFVVVVLFMIFPAGFAALFIALLIPLVIALIGINFRGAAFAMRHFGKETGIEVPVPLLARTFEISSILTPVALGMAVTATAAGTIHLEDGEVVSGLWGWISPFTILGGLVGLAVCAYLTPVYMAVRTTGELQNDFRLRGMTAGVVLGILTALEMPVARASAPAFFARLLSPGEWLIVALAVIFGILTELLLWKRRFLTAQVAAAATVALTLLGYGAALSPDLILDELSFAQASAPRATFIAFFTVLPFGVLILAPSLFFLYWTFRGKPDPHEPLE